MRTVLGGAIIHIGIITCMPAFFALGQPSEIRIESGNLAGATVKIISKERVSQKVVAHSQSIVSQSHESWPVSAVINDRNTNFSASLDAYSYNIGIEKSGTNRSVSFFALVIESKTEPPLWWFCTRPTNGTTVPRDFMVFTTNGNTYASYVQDGPRIFRVNRMRSVETAWREYWEGWGKSEESPDAIKPLRMDVLFEAIGKSPWLHYNSLYFTGAVDDIYELDGELRVILHARRPEPKHTFALRQDKWELISSTGEEMSDAQIEKERRKALMERFEAEMRAKSGQTNNDSGIRTNK